MIDSSYSSLVHLTTYILPTVLFAILLNLPKWFEFRLVMRNESVLMESDENNVTMKVLNATNIDYEVTDLRLDSDYIFYYTHLTRYPVST